MIKKPNVENALHTIEPVTPTALEIRLETSKSKGVAFIACSELGLILPSVPQNEDLNVLIFQNIGNCLDRSHGIEEMLSSGMISDVVVYGHYPCEFIRIQLDNELYFLDNLSDKARSYFNGQGASNLKLFIQDHRKEIEYDELFRKATEQHLMDQLLKISVNLAQPRLHAWLLLDDSKELLCFNGKTARFEKT